MSIIYYAHSIEGRPVEEWHRLEEHLLGTAKLAAQFAGEFGCGEWGYLAGLWHDLGKYFLFRLFVKRTIKERGNTDGTVRSNI